MAIPNNNNAPVESGESIVSFEIDQATAAGVAQLPDDDYMVQVLGHQLKKSQSEGLRMAVFKVQVKSDDPEQDGVVLFHNIMLEGKGFPRFFYQFARAAGVKVDVGKNTVNLNDFTNCLLGVKVVNQEYNGIKRPKIVQVFSLAPPEQPQQTAPVAPPVDKSKL